MKGTVKTFLPEKKYGFIKGDDGKDYFFHTNEFRDKGHIPNICEEAYVGFEQKATPKGYKAKSCYLIDPSEVTTYITPDNFITSKSEGVRGWEVYEKGKWFVHGTSEHSPEAAKKEAILHAEMLGANALTNLEYYKTTGSKPGTGKGTYNYTIHNFRGRITTLAKKNSRGNLSEDNLTGINTQARELKNHFAEKTKTSKRRIAITWAITLALLIALVNKHPTIAIYLFGFSLILSFMLHVNDETKWLEHD